MSRLNESIEQLYVAFASVPRPREIDACPCCTSEDEVCDLISAPNARMVPAEPLSSYASSAFLTVGSATDYLYFLPRILHVSATDDSWWPEPAITGRAIKASAPGSWHADHRTAVATFFSAIVHASLGPERHHLIDDWMCAIGKSGFPVLPHLRSIQKHPDAVLSYFTDNAETLPQGKLANAFWDGRSEPYNEIVDWFRSQPVRTIVEAEYGYVFPEDS